MQAAIGCAQLERFPSFVERRRENFDILYELLSDVSDKLILPEAAPGSKPSWFGFAMTVAEGTDREKVVRYVESKGVQTRMLFAGNLIKHPCFDHIRDRSDMYRVVGELPVTDRIMRDTFWVGLYPGMTREKLEYMAKIIKEAVRS
jgi:CDP-6-deoxy-D-xylo-4-hexulose-3-dehydrase